MLTNKKLDLFLKKNKTKKIVLCHGVFDVMHIGHINYLREAKNFGDILIVSITSKKFVNKGYGRPIFNDSERSNFLKNISFIDYVHINHDYNSISLIKKIKPKFYCKGKEYKNFKNDLTNNIKKEINETRKNGGAFKIINTKAFSSSALINDTFYNYNNEQKKILEIAKRDLGKNKINEIKENLKKKISYYNR
jgi:rfaE bifunctional protein nucleotidyltransferase chain/domain